MTDTDQVEFIELNPGLEKKAGQTAAEVICEAFCNARAQLEDLRQAYVEWQQLDALDREAAWEERGAPEAAYEMYEGPLGSAEWFKQVWQPAREQERDRELASHDDHAMHRETSLEDLLVDEGDEVIFDRSDANTHVLLDDVSPGAIDATLQEAERTRRGARDRSLNAVGDISGTRREGDESLGDSARRALSHIRGRTLQGAFASQLWDMPEKEWAAALEEIRNAGHELYWTHGTVADDPTVTGGWRLDATPEGAAAAEPMRLAQIAQPDPTQDALSEPSARAHPLLNEHRSYPAKTFEVIDRFRSAIGRDGR